MSGTERPELVSSTNVERDLPRISQEWATELPGHLAPGIFYIAEESGQVRAEIVEKLRQIQERKY